MSNSLRRAGAVLLALAAIGILVWNLTPAPSGTEELATPSGAPTSQAGTPPTPSDGPVRSIAPGTREYALALDELRGFPPDLPPGATVELWVSWERPSSPTPKLQRLIPNAVFVRTIAPVIPGGPTSVVLRVPLRRMPDLLWADGFGTLSVAVPS
jgi:hypothetical protein